MLVLELSLVLGLILLNAFFAMSEIAVISARRVLLKRRAEAGARGAQIALELSDDPTRFLSTVQIGITMIGILAGAFSGATIAERIAAPLERYGMTPESAELIAVGLVVLVLTYLSLVIGELVPKRLALARPDAIACRVAPALKLAARIGRPGVELLRISTDGLLKLVGAQPQASVKVTDDEIIALVAEGTQQGVIHPIERMMVEEVLRLADRPVRTVMTRRREIDWLDVSDTADEIGQKIAASAYNRFPVCEGSLDSCLGYVRTREITKHLLESKPLDLRVMVRPVATVPPETKVLEIIGMFRRARPHFALVVDDSSGATLGIVTPADIFETIAGDLAEEVPIPPVVVQRDDGSWIVDARLELQELERAIGAGGLAMGAEFKTLAGLILERIDRVPQVDEVVVINGWRLQVFALDGRRIDKVLISRLPIDPRLAA